MYLLDSNICIYFLKNVYPQLTQRMMSHHNSEMTISAVTVFELLYGAEKSKWGEKTRKNMAMILTPLKVLPFTSNDAIYAAKIRAFLEKRGMPIGSYDLMIAAQGLSNGLTVVTHNTKEFSRVPDLKCEDWVLSD